MERIHSKAPVYWNEGQSRSSMCLVLAVLNVQVEEETFVAGAKPYIVYSNIFKVLV